MMTRRGIERLRSFGTTIFAEMTALAVATDSINLGQGFPDTDGPAEVAEVAIAAIRDGRGNQYPPGAGVPELRQAISRHQQRWYGLDVDPDTEVLVTAGATEAIAAAILGLCEPGDEVVVFEPSYDSYLATIAMAGAVAVTVPLRSPDWSFDPDQLRAAVSPTTRLMLLNTPHNPTGKVFTAAELDEIADVAIERDLIVVTDEVYEHLTFDRDHIPLATRPGMAERTLTISSAGKTFSFTGWKIGWISGPADLIAAVRRVKQFLTYVHGGPFQYAVAHGLGLPDDYFAGVASSLRDGRDQLAAGLSRLGFDPFVPEAGYFVTTDVTPLGEPDGMAFCRALAQQCGVVAIPSVVFYSSKAGVRIGLPLVRWAFCKQRSVLDEALLRLESLRP